MFGNNSNGFGARGGYGGYSSGGAGAVNSSSGGGFGGGYDFGGDDWSNMGSKLRAIDFKMASMKPIEKNIYKEHDVVQSRSQYEIDEWMSTQQGFVEGKDVPRPVFGFNECGFPKEIETLLFKSYEKPTVIQSISWPVAMSGRDIVSIARTGSGKTLGFILPGIMHTLRQPPRKSGEGPAVCVLLPTRELAQQVEAVARDYCRAMKLSITCLFGGASKGPQASALTQGIDICIATPGRLMDFLENGTTNMMRCSYLVLDEADRMLDMGFEPQIRKIMGQIRVSFILYILCLFFIINIFLA